MSITTSYKIRGTKVTSPYPVKLTPAETRLIFTLQKLFLPENIFPDCYFPTPNRSTDQIQIDCLTIGQQGIFVFESKDYSGWIFGNGRQRYWTQTLDFGRTKHQFYNPVLQNANHIRAIRDFIPDHIPTYSIVTFGRDTTIKEISGIPESCTVCTQPQIINAISLIRSSYLLSESEIDSLRQLINQSRTLPNTILRNQHIQEIQALTNN